MSTVGDDDELTFEEIEEPKADAPKAEAVKAEALAAEPETAAAEADPTEAKTEAATDKPIETTAKKRPPLAGIFLAAALGLCLVTSSIAAWKASSAASAISHQAEAEKKPRALDARLASIEKLLEEQRNIIDELSAKPIQTGGSDNAQITALASAVRANQEMSERIPALVAGAVQARVVQVARAAAPSRPAATVAKAVAKVRIAKPAARFQNVARAAPSPPPPPPPGDAIRYP